MKKFFTTVLMLAICLYAVAGNSRNVVVRGLKSGAADSNSALIQKEIDRISSLGGGTVNIPEGDYLTGPIELKSDVCLNIPMGATLRGVADSTAYRKAHVLIGGRKTGFSGLIYASGQKNISITGLGTLEGQGDDPAFDISKTLADPGNRPMLVFLYNCQNINVRDITLHNSAHWTQLYLRCDEVRISGIKVYAHANFNNDGIDIDSRNVVVTNCIIDSDDDAICLKSHYSDFPVENVTISNCIAASNCNAIKFGTASYGGFRNIVISDIAIRRASVDRLRHWTKVVPYLTSDITNLAGIAIETVDGGQSDGITVSNITMTDVQTPIFVRLGDRKRRPDGSMGYLRNVNINSVNAISESQVTCSVTGVPGNYLENVNISDVNISCPGGATDEMIPASVPELEKNYPEARMFGPILPSYGFYFRHAKNVTLRNVVVTPRKDDARPLYLQEDCIDLKL